ncbi:MAG: glycosyltransferase WbuB [Bacteroidetes bacterium]|nr:MAG: glycosyltransferase WbuB [Bacteroidota bacterium]
MKILLLTQYFPPETGAPQNRLHSLAVNLVKSGQSVNVLTAMPNYPKMEVFDSYKGKWYVHEQDGEINIHRSWIFVKKSKAVTARLLNYFSFVFSSLIIGLFKIGKQDIIICESPPLFLGITAMLLKWFKGSKLVFNVSDLWPESAEKLNIVTNKTMLGLSYKLESRIYKTANLVSGQTQGIVHSVQSRFPTVKTFWFRNGIDLSVFNIEATGAEIKQKLAIKHDEFVVLYAGVIGHAQGLDVIVKAANHLKENKPIRFVLAGDGPEKPELQAMIEKLQLSNIEFLPNLSRDKMPDLIAACHAYIVPLKKNDLFLGAIPSKLFEPLAMAKPIILGVDGEAKDLFIDKVACGLHFEPENDHELAKAINQLYKSPELRAQLGKQGQAYVLEKFERSQIAQEFFTQLKEL